MIPFQRLSLQRVSPVSESSLGTRYLAQPNLNKAQAGQGRRHQTWNHSPTHFETHFCPFALYQPLSQSSSYISHHIINIDELLESTPFLRVTQNQHSRCIFTRLSLLPAWSLPATPSYFLQIFLLAIVIPSQPFPSRPKSMPTL